MLFTFLSKRTKITITAVVLALGILFLPSVPFQFKNYFIIGLMLLTYSFSFWALYFEFKKIELLTLFVLPVFITLNAALIVTEFDRFLQSNIVYTVLCSIGFGILMYVTLLVENIFKVSAGRNIPLLRAGHTVGYLATLVVVFLQATLLHNLHLNPLILGLLILVSCFALYLQALWQIELEEHITFDLILSSIMFSIITSEYAIIFTFWPLNPLTFGLTLASSVYLLVGLKQHQLKSNLTSRVMKEYFLVGASVFLLLLFVTSWRG